MECLTDAIDRLIAKLKAVKLMPVEMMTKDNERAIIEGIAQLNVILSNSKIEEVMQFNSQLLPLEIKYTEIVVFTLSCQINAAKRNTQMSSELVTSQTIEALQDCYLKEPFSLEKLALSREVKYIDSVGRFSFIGYGAFSQAIHFTSKCWLSERSHRYFMDSQAKSPYPSVNNF